MAENVFPKTAMFWAKRHAYAIHLMMSHRVAMTPVRQPGLLWKFRAHRRVALTQEKKAEMRAAEMFRNDPKDQEAQPGQETRVLKPMPLPSFLRWGHFQIAGWAHSLYTTPRSTYSSAG